MHEHDYEYMCRSLFDNQQYLERSVVSMDKHTAGRISEANDVKKINIGFDMDYQCIKMNWYRKKTHISSECRLCPTYTNMWIDVILSLGRYTTVIKANILLNKTIFLFLFFFFC